MEDRLEGRRHLHRDVHVLQAVHGWGVADGCAGVRSHDVWARLVGGTRISPIRASQPSLRAIDKPKNKDIVIYIDIKEGWSTYLLSKCHRWRTRMVKQKSFNSLR